MNNSSNLNFSIHEMNNETLSNHEESFLSKLNSNNHKQDSITASNANLSFCEENVFFEVGIYWENF